jgi:hypothetical protein
MNRQELIDLNENIFHSIELNSKSFTKKNCNKKLLKKINSLVEKVWFKSLFENFCSFFSVANKKHPDFFDVIDNLFPEYFIEKCLDIDKTYNYIKENNIVIHDAFVVSIKKFFTEDEIKRLNYYDNPEKNRIATRFLDVDRKWNLRKFKREQVILKKINSKINLDVKKGINSISHNSNDLKEYIKELGLKKKSMLEINCIQLAAEIEEYMGRIKENINLSKHGFYRVSISKLLELAASIFEYSGAEIMPIKDKNYLRQYPIPQFLELCDNFFGKNLSIFDNYAQIKFVGGPFSFLVGEIDSKSYFVGLIHE